MKSIVRVLMILLLAQASAAQPGTRKLKIVEKEPLYICLAPRDCQCEPPNQSEKTKSKLCSCWWDFDQEDQPAVVGRISCVLRYAVAFKTDLLAPFAAWAASDGCVCVRIPSPGDGIKKFLEFYGASELFQLLKPGEVVDAVHFLRFVAQGKWVIADIDESAEDSRVYHMYLHDLNNHLFLWWLMPSEWRTLIQERAHALDQMFRELRAKLSSVPLAIDYIQMLNCLAGFMIDVKMGNLNVKVLHFTEERVKTINDLECMLNFCVTKECERKEGMFYVLKLSPNEFALEWFSVYQNWLLNNLRGFFESGAFDEEEKFSKDNATKEALARLKAAHPETIEELAKEIGQEGPKELVLDAHSYEEEFSNPIKRKLKEAVELQSHDTSHGLNVRALLADPTIPAENANVIADALLTDLMRIDGSGI